MRTSTATGLAAPTGDTWLPGVHAITLPALKAAFHRFIQETGAAVCQHKMTVPRSVTAPVKDAPFGDQTARIQTVIQGSTPQFIATKGLFLRSLR